MIARKEISNSKAFRQHRACISYVTSLDAQTVVATLNWRFILGRIVWQRRSSPHVERWRRLANGAHHTGYSCGRTQPGVRSRLCSSTFLLEQTTGRNRHIASHSRRNSTSRWSRPSAIDPDIVGDVLNFGGCMRRRALHSRMFRKGHRDIHSFIYGLRWG